MLTNEQIAAYRRDGVLHVPAVFDPADVKLASVAIEKVLASPGLLAMVASGVDDPGHFIEDFRRWQDIPEIEWLARNSRVPELAAELLGTPELRLYHDHVLVKEGGTGQRTPCTRTSPVTTSTGLARFGRDACLDADEGEHCDGNVDEVKDLPRGHGEGETGGGRADRQADETSGGNDRQGADSDRRTDDAVPQNHGSGHALERPAKWKESHFLQPLVRSKYRAARFRRHLEDDLGHVFELLRAGTITAKIAAQFPLTEAAAALALAESRTLNGKVILLPQPPSGHQRPDRVTWPPASVCSPPQSVPSLRTQRPKALPLHDSHRSWTHR